MKLSTRLAFAMVALVLLTAAAVGAITYRNVAALALPRALDRIDMQAQIIAVRANLAGGVDPIEGMPETLLRERLTSRFVAELNAKPSYSPFRLVGIGDGGREIVRVDRSGPAGVIQSIPEAELQRKGDRNYLTEAIRLLPARLTPRVGWAWS